MPGMPFEFLAKRPWIDLSDHSYTDDLNRTLFYFLADDCQPKGRPEVMVGEGEVGQA